MKKPAENKIEKDANDNILRCATGSTEEASDASTATNSISPMNDGFCLGISPVNCEQLSHGASYIIDTNRLLRNASTTAVNDDQNNYMIAPSTREEKENERYARKVGICFSITRGDYLTLFSGMGDDESMTDISATLSMSPQYGKKDDCFTFREMYGDVHQILEVPSPKEANVIHQVVDSANPDDSMAVQPHHELLTPRTRTAMIIHNDVLETIRERAAILSKDWADKDNLAPSLARRLRDFEFAQKKRRKMLGKTRKWGILGMYDFLSAVRQDVEWAEEAAFRRSNCLPYLRWYDFVESKKIGSNRPFFAYGILLICSITLIISIGLNGWTFESMTRNPSIGPSAEVLVQMGAKQSDLIVNSYHVWRLIAPMILHGGIVHFLLNCFAMFYIGRAVEQNHGFVSAVLLFTVSAIGSTVISAIFLPQFISVGSSGGIFGLIGACVADIIKNRKLLFSDFINKGRSRRHHAFVVLVLVIDIFLNLLMGLTPYTDNFMHIGGFILGFVCASTMLSQVDIVGEKRYHFRSRIYLIFSRYFGLVISCVCILAALAILFTGDGTSSPCESCGVLSCVSLPPWADQDKKWWYCDDCGAVKAFGKKDPVTNEYVAIEMECPQGNSITFSLDGIANDKGSLQKNLPKFCRERCFG